MCLLQLKWSTLVNSRYQNHTVLILLITLINPQLSVGKSQTEPKPAHPGHIPYTTTQTEKIIPHFFQEQEDEEWKPDLAKFHVPPNAKVMLLSNNMIHTEPTIFTPETHIGHDISYTVFKNSIPSSQNYILFNGMRYNLYQFHLHKPADHKVNSHKAPAELHIIYKNSNNDYLVLGILFDTFDDKNHTKNDQFDRMLEVLKNILNAEKRSSHSIDSLLPHDRTVYSFEGTTTVPPLLHSVQWRVFTHAIQITDDQLKRLYNLNIVLHHPESPVRMQRIQEDVTEDMDI